MIVDTIKVEGIANIESVSLNIGDINALVAPNGYGKSNVLRAIDFGIVFLRAAEYERKQMLGGGFVPLNNNILGKRYCFEISGRTDHGNSYCFQYGYECNWACDGVDGGIAKEWLKVRSSEDKRYRLLVNREEADKGLIVPSVKGRCDKLYKVNRLQLILPLLATNGLFMSELASAVCNIEMPYLDTLDNPESYFSADDTKGVQMLGGVTLSEYLFRLKEMDSDSYGILSDGLMQLIPGIEEFEPTEIVLSDGQSKIYDIRIKERHNAQSTSVRKLSSGSKRIVFLFTLCMAARRQNIPLIMMEEPENSVHPQLMENLLLTIQAFASDTSILLTSHSPYLMRYLQPDQVYFGLPKNDGLAHFAKVNPSKVRRLYRYAGDLELTFGEYMFDFMLDIENDAEKLSAFFKE